MEHDDVQIGRILSRREVLGLLGAGGAAALASPRTASAAMPGTGSAPAADPAAARNAFRLPKCIVRPSQTAGPYFVDTDLDRSDIRSDPTDGSMREGAPLALEFRVSRLDAQRCEPLAGALVDVWQCDAEGVYSGVKDINARFDTTDMRFLRGHQVTDGDGVARFTTIYPGWYRGRTVHIHFMIRTHPGDDAGEEFASQLYFDDELTDRVFESQPYASQSGRRTRNPDDFIFRSGGSQLLLDVSEDGGGYRAVFDIGLQVG
jgi:protocatechuate 3,4-dioxygenase beta subunit